MAELLLTAAELLFQETGHSERMSKRDMAGDKQQKQSSEKKFKVIKAQAERRYFLPFVFREPQIEQKIVRLMVGTAMTNDKNSFDWFSLALVGSECESNNDLALISWIWYSSIHCSRPPFSSPPEKMKQLTAFLSL